jgi:hypothetical protein
MSVNRMVAMERSGCIRQAYSYVAALSVKNIARAEGIQTPALVTVFVTAPFKLHQIARSPKCKEAPP